MSHSRRSVPSTFIFIFSLLCTPPVWAVGIQDFPTSLPNNLIVDSANVLSRATSSELDRRLESFGGVDLDARLVTVKQLDYGLTLDQLGTALVDRWTINDNDKILLLLIETQTNNATIVASNILQKNLTHDLLENTAKTTMAIPLREGERYRQASVEAIDRLEAVLNGEEDPGPPIESEFTRPSSNIPSQEETASSQAFTWVVALLVIGTIIPMLTWWVFSR